MKNKVLLHPRQEMWRLMNLIWRRPFRVSPCDFLEVDFKHFVPGGKYEHFQYNDNGEAAVVDPDNINFEVTREEYRYNYNVPLSAGMTEVLLNSETLVPSEVPPNAPEDLRSEQFSELLKGDAILLTIGANKSAFLMACGLVE